MVLVSMLFPAFLLLGCNAPTGPYEDPGENEPLVQEPAEAPDRAVRTDGCFELDGELHCADTEDPGNGLRVK
jgi:hypothetical protein